MTGKLENMVQVAGRDQIGSKIKAVVALLPYAVWRERGGDNRMADACLAVIRIPDARTRVGRTIALLLDEGDLEIPSWVMTLVSPYGNWVYVSNTDTVTRWAAAALTVPYTEEVGRSVVNALLQIAYFDRLLPYIPVNIWAWLKKRPTLPPFCRGRSLGTVSHVVRRVRELGDVELLKSYFLLVWSEWNYVLSFSEMCASIGEDFSGIRMWRHRKVLTERLDHILRQLDLGLEHLRQQNPYLGEDHVQTAEGQYGWLKELLLEMDREASETLTRMPFILFEFVRFAHLGGFPQNPTQRSFVRSRSHVRSRASAALAPWALFPNPVLHSRICHPPSPLQLHR